MNIEMSAKTAKTFVKAIEKLNEESLLVFDEEGVRTKVVDGENASLLDVRIPKSSVNAFSFSEASATEVGVVVERMKDLTKTLTVKDTINIDYNMETPTWLTMSANGVERKVRLLNSAHMKRIQTPSTEHHWSVSLPMKEVKAFIKSLGAANGFTITIGDKKVALHAETDDGEIRLDLNETNLLHAEEGSFSTKVSTDKFSKILAATGIKTVVTLKGSNEAVIEAQWTEAGMNFVGWVAPLTR